MPIGDLLAQITGEPSPTATSMPPLPKRKADDQLRKPVDKVQKTRSAGADSSRPTTQVSRPSTVDSSTKMKLGQNVRPATVQGGSATFKNGQPTPPPQSEPPKPLKKGSFAEIMARAKAAQATSTQVGKIQHKRIEKLPSKRERAEMKAAKAAKIRKNLGPNGKFRAAGQPPLKDDRNGVRENSGKVSNGKVGTEKKPTKPTEPVAEKKVKKAALATTGYAGTARPKPGARGSSRPSSSSRYERGSDRYGSSSKRYHYASEEEEEEEEEDDYGSDVSSDMEAAVFEVDDEEERAARIARREDAEALAEENHHKREKEEKRKRLAALAAKARR